MIGTPWLLWMYIPSILTSYQCIGCLLDSCQPVQFKLHTAPLNYSIPHYLAKSGPTRQQTQLVNSVKPGVAGAILGFSQWGCSLRAKRAAKFRPRPLPGSRPFCRQRPLFSRWCTATVLTVFYSAISKSRMLTTRSSICLGCQTLANSS